MNTMLLTAITIEGIKNAFSNASVQSLGALSFLLIAYYAIECFFGYKIFRVKCAVVGFLAGAVLGLLLAGALGISGTGWFILFACVIGAVLGGLSFSIYKFGVFFMSALIGFALGYFIFGAVVGLVMGIVIGIIALFLTKPTIIISSAISGGLGLADCIFSFFQKQNSTAAILVGIVLCGLGVFLQVRMNHGIK